MIAKIYKLANNEKIVIPLGFAFLLNKTAFAFFVGQESSDNEFVEKY